MVNSIRTEETEDVNSCKDILRSDLKDTLLAHAGFRSWHYGIDLSDKDNPSSLSQYLKFTKDRYEDLLEIIGLGEKKKYGKIRRFEMIFKEWVQFLVSIGMDPGMNNNYFDKTKVNRIEKNKRYWLLLGDISQTETIRELYDEKRSRNKGKGAVNNVTAFNPTTQFDFSSHPPRVNSSELKNLSDHIIQIINLYNHWDDNDDEDSDDDGDDDEVDDVDDVDDDETKDNNWTTKESTDTNMSVADNAVDDNGDDDKDDDVDDSKDEESNDNKSKESSDTNMSVADNAVENNNDD